MPGVPFDKGPESRDFFSFARRDLPPGEFISVGIMRDRLGELEKFPSLSFYQLTKDVRNECLMSRNAGIRTKMSRRNIIIEKRINIAMLLARRAKIKEGR